MANLFGNSASTGFADRFNTAVNDLLGANGIITTKQTSINQNITDETNHQQALQTRLNTERTSLLQQYTSLNSALSAMQQSTNNLASLIASA